MKKQRLKDLAGIITEMEDPTTAWKAFSRASADMERALRNVNIADGGPDERGSGTLNQLQISDVEYSLNLVKAQLDRLDRIYKWRDHMTQRRERMKVT